MAPRKQTKKSSTTAKKTAPKRSVSRRTSPAPMDDDMKPMTSTSSASDAAHENNWRKKFFVPIIIVLLAILAYVAMQQLVAATVNGRPISRITLAREMERRMGEQMLEELVMNELIKQAARDQGITVTEEEIDAEITELREQFEASGQNFDDVVALQGYTMDKVREVMRLQLIQEKALSEDIAITEEQIDAFIEQNSAFLPEDQDTADPAFREDIKEQLKQQEIGTRMQSWIEELKTQADIKYYGPFKKAPTPTVAPMQVPEGDMQMEESADVTAPPVE